ncbi:hypothetical protein HNO88_004319 [Novosphingobium chloroacetimidivorans]|uniref:Transposase n=1 Tax=Novosphingobium chloroacetimidivorans TaxID=1428314 RepID=A0A7W7KF82_9SPHN|nr:hypothetical protein [Novosphingobium chloroacetimidivorans]
MNSVERSIQPIALNRKNALYAGSDEGGDHWAVIATIIEISLSSIIPKDLLTRTLVVPANRPANRLVELVPWVTVA